MAAEIDKEIKKIIDRAYQRATELLKEHHDQLDLVANALTEHEKLDGEDFRQLMENGVMDEHKVSSTTLFDQGASAQMKGEEELNIEIKTEE